MARVDNLTNFVTDIASAIRDAENTTELIPASNFDDRIRALSGGVQPPTTGEFSIRYFYRDTVTGDEKIHTQLLNKGENGIFPTDVGNVQQTSNNPALIFQGWNFTQLQISNVLNNIDVGAMYITADGKTYFYIRVTRATGTDEANALVQTIYLNKSDTSTLSLDWGDGTTIETISSSGNFNRTHTYSQTGDYWVIVWISVGTGTFIFGNQTATTTIFGGNNQSKRNILRSIFIGNSVLSLSNYALYSCYSLTSATIPYGIISFGNQAFNGANLTSVTIPNSVTSIGTNALNGYILSLATIPYGITIISNGIFNLCYNIPSITIPSGVTSIGTNAFYSCYSLNSIKIPNSVTSIGSAAFSSCISLRTITFPDSITSIGAYAFQGIRAPIEYIFESILPPTLADANVFEDINSTSVIYVPDQSVEAYKTATNWITRAAQIYPRSSRSVN